MTKYKQLSQEQRYVIGRLLKAGKDKAEIATAIGVDRSTHLAQASRLCHNRRGRFLVSARVYNLKKEELSYIVE